MERWLDDVARIVASGMSRRQALKRLGAGLAGAVLGSMPPGQAAAQTCRAPGDPCRTNAECCSKVCSQGRCLAPGDKDCRDVGQQCRSNAECCSKVCNQGTCALPGDKDCREVGRNCRSNAECCSKLCTNGQCATCPPGALICEGQCAPCPPLDPVADQCKVLGCGRTAQGVPICEKQNKPNGTACNDGNPCTVNDACQNGACQSGPPKNCDDGNPCTVDTCNPTTGACVHTPISCPTGQRCVGGACVCDATSCPNGCCQGNICTTTAFPGTCGTSGFGTVCVACSTTTANNCTNGQCRCGAGPACPSGQVCRNEDQRCGECTGALGCFTSPPQCGPGSGVFPFTLGCGCAESVEGEVRCYNHLFCSATAPCTSTAQCVSQFGPGYFCPKTPFCCGQICLPPCNATPPVGAATRVESTSPGADGLRPTSLGPR